MLSFCIEKYTVSVHMLNMKQRKYHLIIISQVCK